MFFRLSQRFSIKYSFSNQLSLNQLYSHHDISQRIQALQLIRLDQLDGVQLPHRPIILPPYIKIGTAKNLVDFHRQRNTKQNLITLHALAFIQFNAFQAYSDTMIRFTCSGQIPDGINLTKIGQFQQDMKNIAIDQGAHCLMLIKRIQQLGHSFGEFPVIQNLSNMVNITTSSVIDRLALVSIVHQGRGTKSIEKLIHKMYSCQDMESAKLLRKIESEQIEHLKKGLKWFKYFCDQKIKKEKSSDQKEGFLQQYQNILEQINLKYKTKIRMSDLNSPQKSRRTNLVK